MVRFPLAVALMLAAIVPAVAAGLPSGMSPVETAAVREVIDGDTLALTDGRVVRLVAIAAPKPDRRAAERARTRHDQRLETVAAASRAALAELVVGREIGLAGDLGTTDRYGRILAHVVDPMGRWAQAELVARGLARVASSPETRAGAAALLALEEAARRAHRGLWALPEFRIIGPDEARRSIDSFQLVEGQVRDAARKGGNVWLNFGADWRSDFTILIPPAARRLFAAAGLDPAQYGGKMLRVRGWIVSRNGPLIEVTHPEQIEMIEP